jgi:hypothetical protein
MYLFSASELLMCIAVFVLSSVFNDVPAVDLLPKNSFYDSLSYTTLNRFCIVGLICIIYGIIVKGMLKLNVAPLPLELFSAHILPP